VVFNDTFDFSNKSTLELGGGLGMGTLAVMSRYNTRRTVMTDVVADALKVYEFSVELLPVHRIANTSTLCGSF
jgi:methylase of polypeptide subunit release factors